MDEDYREKHAKMRIRLHEKPGTGSWEEVRTKLRRPLEASWEAERKNKICKSRLKQDDLQHLHVSNGTLLEKPRPLLAKQVSGVPL